MKNSYTVHLILLYKGYIELIAPSLKVEHDLEAEFGEYYDEIMNVMIVKEYTSESGTNRKSGFISILDFSDIVKN